MKITLGRRVEIQKQAIDLYIDDLKVGDYGYTIDGYFYARLPCGDMTYIDDRKWTFAEHQDKTITISPSINLVGKWHGFLDNGIWKEC